MQSDRASILWTTLESGDGKVVIGWPDGSVSRIPAASRAFRPAVTKLPYTFYQYQADLTSLDPGTQYAYRITLNGATLTSGPGFFRTAAPGKFSFMAFGDSGENTPRQRASIPLMGAEPDVSFLLHTGDLAYPEGSFAQYDSNYFGLNAPLFERLPVFPTPGNHEYMTDSAAPYLASHFTPESAVNSADIGRYYSFDWGDAHFTSIDSNLMPTNASDRMLAWLENDLESTRQFWKIVFFHHPPYPTGHHVNDAICAAVRARVNPIVERHGVQLVLSGHEHGYERTAPLSADERLRPGLGTTYVITGGGGASLHDVNCGRQTDFALETYNYLRVDVDGSMLTVRAIDSDGREIERFALRPQPVIESVSVMSGSLVNILGQNLALRPQTASGAPLPLDLGGVRAQLGDQDIALLSVAPRQINVQIPDGIQGQAELQIFGENGSAQAALSIPSDRPVTAASRQIVCA